MKKRIIIHAGFHKTGTTSAQKFLAKNQSALARDGIRLFLRNSLEEMKRAVINQTNGKDVHGREFRKSLNNLFKIWAADDNHHTIIFSQEDFIGRMPYRCPASSYDFAKLNLQICEEEAKKYGGDLEVSYFFSLRNQRKWEESVYWHLVRSDIFEEDLDLFCETLGAKNNLEIYCQEFISVVGKERFFTSNLCTTSALPYGPAQSLLDLAYGPSNVPTNLASSPIMNKQYSIELQEKLLEANRMKNVSATEKKQLKRELISLYELLETHY